MWLPFHSAWLFLIVPLAMTLLLCVLMRIVMCRPCGGAGCCRHMHRDDHEQQGTPSRDLGAN